MTYSTLKLQQDGAILRVTISNPPINTMSVKMVEELFQLAGGLQIDTTIKVVLFDSADPDFFIAHFDLNDFVSAASDPSKASKYPDINVVQALIQCWQALPQVTIGKVDGRCRGGGLEFLLGLHMRFASSESLFCFPEASLGFLACGSGVTRMALSVGPARALEVVLSARDFSAEEAERYGFINRALPANELDGYVDDLVERLGKRSREVIAINREVLTRVQAPFVDSFFAGLAAENDGLRASLASPELQSLIAAMISQGQEREVERDLPASITMLLAAQQKESDR